MLKHRYYVYIHKRLSDGSVFYVGKGGDGTGKRARSSSGRSEWWRMVSAKHGFEALITFNSESHDDCILLEMWLIAKFKNDGLALVNMTEGGEGQLGYSPSQEVRARASKRLKGVAPSENTRAAQIRSASKAVISSDGVIYSSATEAAKKLFPGNIMAAKSGISSCIRGRTKAYKGIGFSVFSGDPFSVAYRSKRKTKAVHSDRGEYFTSISAAAKAVCANLNRSSAANITQAAKGRVGTAYGRKWFYTEDSLTC